MTRLFAVCAAAALAVGACSKNPVTGKRQLALVSESQEIELGKQAVPEIVATMGKYPDPKVQAYVESIGKRMAAQSERPNLPWSFIVLDDPTVNAFALPGGPVFVTRGILTHLNSEAELAAVLGHEIGHITARHSVDQLSKAQLAQLGLGVGMILKPELATLGQAAGAGLQLLFLKHGRDAERQSDDLGFKYMLAHNYDVREMAGVFETLGRASKAAGGGKIPEWASTHPNPENREEKARERAATVPPAQLASLQTGRPQYMQLLAGMPFGENPRHGFFKGNAFLHPDLKFQVQLPDGWKKANTPSAVVAVSPKEDAMIQLAHAGNLSPADATKKFFSQQGVRPAQVAQGTTAAGLPATSSYFEAQAKEATIRGIVSFVAHGGSTYQIVGYTEASRLPGYDPALRQAIASFGPLTDPQALAVQPAKIELVQVPRDMSVAEFHAQFPSTAPVEQVAVLNGQGDANGRLKAGQLAKRVTGGVPPPK